MDTETGLPYLLEINPRFGIIMSMMGDNGGKNADTLLFTCDLLKNPKLDECFLKQKEFIYCVGMNFYFENLDKK